MASSTSKMGTSFKVDDVQELAKLKGEDVPQRYIRPLQERIGCTALSAPPGLHVPLIDMVKLLSSHHSTRQHEMDRLARACKEWGFFQVSNHGIDRELLELIKKVAREFFKLPFQEKDKYAMLPGTIQGYGHGFVFSDDQNLDWSDMMALGTMPKSIRKENLWPAKPLLFSDTVEAYSMEVSTLCWKLLSAIAENLGLQPNIFEAMFGEIVQAVLTNGEYKSVEHRAVTNRSKERLSIATFHAPSYDVELGPLPQLIDEDHPRLYKNYKHADYNRHYLTHKLEGKKSLDFARI